MDAAAFLEAIDEKRAGIRPLEVVCGSCGKNPPLEGFVMCVECRIKADLPVPEEARREDEAKTTPTQAKEEPVNEQSTTETTDKRSVTLHCDHCGTTCRGGGGKSAHERRCPKNPANAKGTDTTPEVSIEPELTPADTSTDTQAEAAEIRADLEADGIPAEKLDELLEAPTQYSEWPVRCGVLRVSHSSVELKLAVRDRDETIDILAKRIDELESERASCLFCSIWNAFRKLPYGRHGYAEQRVAAIRLWARKELKDRKRARFMLRLMQAVTEMDEALFGAEDVA